MSVYQKVVKIIVQVLNVDESEVHERASFEDDLGANELAFMELVMAFNEEFGIFIPDESAGSMFTVRDALDCVISSGGRDSE